jgi:signal peptide peptidase SppA
MIDKGLILGRVINTPLLAHPRKAVIVYNFLVGHFPNSNHAEVPLPGDDDFVSSRLRELESRRSTPMASQFAGEFIPSEEDRKGIEPFRMTRDGVGLITVTGSLVNRGAWVGKSSGVTSYEGIKYQFQRAAANSKVKSIILDIESPGGEAVGAFEAGNIVRQVNAEKPVYTVVNGMAASAGYALAAGSKRIVTTPTGITGSIGVVMLHIDWSKFLEQKGIQPTLIHAGANKVDGNPYEPLSEDARADIQAEIDQFYGLFLDHVAQGRGRRLTKTKARETEARTYIGKAAVEAGVADDVGTFEEVLDEARSRARQSNSKPKARNASMSRLLNDETDQANEVEAARQAGQKAGHEAGRAEGFAAGRAEGLTTGAEGERSRIAAIVGDERVKGHEAAALEMAVEFPTATADQVAKMIGRFGAAAPAQPQGATLASRTEATGVNRVGATLSSQDQARTDQAQTAASLWGEAVAQANKKVPGAKH